MQHVSHVRFIGVTIEACRGNAVVATSTSDVHLLNCTVRNAGSSAVSFSGADESSIRGGEVVSAVILSSCPQLVTLTRLLLRQAFAGCKGVELDGGDTKTLKAGGNVVSDVHIHHWAQTCLTYQPGLSLSGVGNLASNNDVHTSPHHGVSIGGNDQTVQYNRIHHTSEDSFDNGRAQPPPAC